MENWVVNPASTHTAESMICALAGMCDGAFQIDGAGFSRFDAEFGHSLANHANSGRPWTLKQASAALRIVRKYQNDLNNDSVRAQLIEQFNELPFNPASYSHLMDQVIGFNKQAMAIDGELLRIAESCGIAREQWLPQYLASDDLTWIVDKTEKGYSALREKHKDRIAVLESQMSGVRNDSGMSIRELRMAVRDLRKHAKSKEESIQRMVTSNLRLVVSIAKRYAMQNPAGMLDLVQEGNIGLIKAVEKFKWQLGYRFSTYATWWIRQAIIKATTEQNKTIRVPSHVLDAIKKINRAIRDFVDMHGYEPSDAELGKILEMEPEKISRMMQVAKDPISLETPVGDDEDANIGNYIEDDSAVNTVDKINDDDISKIISEALGTLSSREERVLRMRFGIGTMDEHTLEEIGQRFNVTRERIRQIEVKALQRLKNPQRLKELEAALEG